MRPAAGAIAWAELAVVVLLGGAVLLVGAVLLQGAALVHATPGLSTTRS